MDFTMGATNMTRQNKVSVVNFNTRGFEMAKTETRNLQDFILGIDATEVSVDDVLLAFWDDWDTITKREKYLQGVLEDAKKQRGNLPRGERRSHYLREEAPVKTDLLKLRNLPKSRRARVKTAFNQLFLAGKVKQVPYPRPEFGTDYHTPRTFEEYKEWQIQYCIKLIESTKASLSKDNNIFARCWLSTLYYYLESYQHSEVLDTRKIEDWLKRAYKPEAKLFCVGELTTHTWPDKIAKFDKPKCRQAPLFKFDSHPAVQDPAYTGIQEYGLAVPARGN
jgi:hypothetical protein